MSVLWGAAVLAAAAAPLAPKGMEPAQATEEALREALAPRRRAIVVGVDAYDDPTFPDLAHAGADAKAIAGVLGRPGGFDEVTVLVRPSETTRAALFLALRLAAAELRAQDELVVYFSGHGTQAVVDDGVHHYLLVRDSRPEDLARTAVDLAGLQGFLSEMAPARKALVVDACFHGDGKSVVGSVTADPRLPFTPRATAMGPSEAHMYATSPGRPALEDDGVGHGVYTWYLLEALTWAFRDADRDEDGVVTTWEAHDHARGKVVAHTGGLQVPEAAFRVVGEGDLVLAGNPIERRRRDHALLYLYSPSVAAAEVRVTLDGRSKGALPGTVPLPAGRHHVRLEDPDGGVLLDAPVTLRSGASYRPEDLVRLGRGPRRILAMRAAATGVAGWRPVLGAGALGVEVGGVARKDDAPSRGLCLEAYGGLGMKPDGEAPRSAWTLGVGAGTQHDWRRLRLRATLGVSGAWLPPGEAGAALDDPRDDPDQAGWWFVAMGPALAGGFVASDAVAIVAYARPHVAALDRDLDGRVSPLWWTTTGVGTELSW